MVSGVNVNHLDHWVKIDPVEPPIECHSVVIEGLLPLMLILSNFAQVVTSKPDFDEVVRSSWMQQFQDRVSRQPVPDVTTLSSGCTPIVHFTPTLFPARSSLVLLGFDLTPSEHTRNRCIMRVRGRKCAGASRPNARKLHGACLWPKGLPDEKNQVGRASNTTAQRVSAGETTLVVRPSEQEKHSVEGKAQEGPKMTTTAACATCRVIFRNLDFSAQS